MRLLFGLWLTASAGDLPAAATLPGFEFTNLQSDVRKFAEVGEPPKSPMLRQSGRR